MVYVFGLHLKIVNFCQYSFYFSSSKYVFVFIDDSDLNLHIDVPDMNVAIPLTDGGFGHCWAGARSSHGVNQGKVCYEVFILYLFFFSLSNIGNSNL